MNKSKKIIVGILLLTCVFLNFVGTHKENEWVHVMNVYMILVSIMIVLDLFLKTKFGNRFRNIIFVTMFLVMGAAGVKLDYLSVDEKDIIIWTLVTLSIIAMIFKDLKKVVDNGGRLDRPMSKNRFRVNLVIFFYTVIVEEIFFRCFMGKINIIIVAILFVVYHIAVREGVKKNDVKIFVHQFLLSIVLSTAFIYSESLWIVVAGHLVFDIPYVLSLFYRTKVSKESYSFEY